MGFNRIDCEYNGTNWVHNKESREMKSMVGNGGIEVSCMQFGYDGSHTPLFAKFDLQIPPGSRCLLVGANGSGKTTLLKILAGKHMVGGQDVVKILDSSAFHDTQLVCSGDLAYLGHSWSRSIGAAVSRLIFYYHYKREENSNNSENR